MMKMQEMLKVTAAVAVAVSLFTGADASVLSAPINAGLKKASAFFGGRVAAKAVVRGGAELAKVRAARAVAKSAAKTAEAVTPTKILAAGASVAAVTAAHEAADGVQQVGCGIGKAVSEHPEIAEGVMDKAVKPFNWIAVILTVAVSGVLIWVVFPLFGLLRSLVKFCAKRMKPKSQMVARPGSVNIRLLLAVAGMLVVAFVTVSSALRENDVGCGGSIKAGVSDNTKAGAHAEVMEAMKDEFLQTVRRHYHEFAEKVSRVSKEEYGRVRSRIPAVANTYGSFSRLKGFVCDMVMDRFDNGKRVEKEVKHDLETDFYPGLYQARETVVACIEEFRGQLTADYATFAAGIRAELASESLPSDDAYESLLTDCGDRITAVKDQLTQVQNNAGIATGIEVIMIRGTVSVLTKFLGKCVVRMVASISGGAIASAADGPLPFGEIATVVVVAATSGMTVYDIYQATKVVPDAMRTTMSESVDRCERETCSEVLRVGYAMLSSCESN